MCGIIGITGKNVREYDTKIGSMLATLKKRGPDENGKISFPTCLLGQTRLSILDISGGKQPMRDNSKNIAITFNGEIYNYPELKKELGEKGHKFSTNSDTEVILKTYLEYGIKCPEHLEGMFSFAIWDEDKKTLLAARDRFGEKPFYYATDEQGGLIFASEIKAILASGKIKGEIDPESIDAYLALMYIPPDRTIYKNIHVLPPATLLIAKDGKIELKKYWFLKKETINISYDDAKKEIKKLLGESVKKMMVADVEVGAFLSGGVDSTLVTKYAQKNSSSPVKTFSVGYENHINELPFALQASQKIGTDHYTLQTKGGSMEDLEAIYAYMDEPHADSANLAQYQVSRLASSKVKVALTGDGADELFMGYGWYFKQHNLSWKKDFFDKLFPRPFNKYLKTIQVFSPEERIKLWIKNPAQKRLDLNKMKAEGKNPIDKINYFDLNYYLPGQLLSKVDRMAMANSLETRCPFLDKKLAEFVFSLPNEYKMDKKGGKIILKDILEEIMGKEFANRRKQGFGAPIKQWLLEDKIKKTVNKKLLGTEANIHKILDKTEIKNLVDGFYTKDHNSEYKIWSLLCLELWFESHKN